MIPANITPSLQPRMLLAMYAAMCMCILLIYHFQVIGDFCFFFRGEGGGCRQSIYCFCCFCDAEGMMSFVVLFLNNQTKADETAIKPDTTTTHKKTLAAWSVFSSHDRCIIFLFFLLIIFIQKTQILVFL